MLPIQVIATALVAFLTIRTIGVQSYATVGLLIGLQALFGFLSLGTSAAISSAAGESLTLGSEHLARVSVTAIRITLMAGGALLPLSGIVTLLGLWPDILGQGDPALLTLGALVAMVGVALVQPFRQGNAILMATGHTVSATILTVAASLVTLVSVFVASLLRAAPIMFVICPYSAEIVVAILSCVIAARTVGLSLRTLAYAVKDRGFRGARIMKQSIPALVMWVLLPLGLQTDRLLINHLSTSDQLASYNLAAQGFSALFSIVAVGSASLWGHFANARITATLPQAGVFSRLSLAFAGIGAILGAGYVIAMPFAVSLVSDSQVSVSRMTLVCFGVLLIVQSFHQPSAMLQTDKLGLWFNAGAVAVMTVLNLGLGLLLTRPLGAAGPVIASFVAITLGLALPSFVRARLTLVRAEKETVSISKL